MLKVCNFIFVEAIKWFSGLNSVVRMSELNKKEH